MGEITVNGRARTVPGDPTLGGLLRELDLDPRWVVAELNGEIVARERFDSASISGGDRIELVRPVAGG